MMCYMINMQKSEILNDLVYPTIEDTIVKIINEKFESLMDNNGLINIPEPNDRPFKQKKFTWSAPKLTIPKLSTGSYKLPSPFGKVRLFQNFASKPRHRT